jgi:hypothetical protein
MATENGLAAFSVRLPTELVQQIDSRRVLSRRTRNAEIQVLLEQAIDLNVARDLKLLNKTAKDSISEVTLGS